MWVWLGWLLLAMSVWMLWPVWLGLARRRYLIQTPPLPVDAGDAPLVSIIVPARDEEREIESALRGMLALDYPRYEIIAINDRSKDATGRIMEKVAADEPRCRVIQVEELPAGWLGKNHANWLGARVAAGEYLLFTDGDVKFRPEVLRHAIAHVREQGLDHLTLLPDPGRGSFWEGVLMTWFVLSFNLFTRAALVRYRWAKKAFVGIGAFNLVRRAAYEAIGTHERLRMEVADDVMLGKLLKTAGFKQDVLRGRPLVHVRWQTGVWGIIRGLEKNAFAGARYSVPHVAGGVLVNLIIAVLPLGLLLPWPLGGIAAIMMAMFAGTYLLVGREVGYGSAITLFYPMGAALFAYVLARSTYVTLRDGGITWRGTFYPLAELKRGMV